MTNNQPQPQEGELRKLAETIKDTIIEGMQYFPQPNSWVLAFDWKEKVIAQLTQLRAEDKGEIEKLRAQYSHAVDEVAKLRKAKEELINQTCQLTKERDELREALEELCQLKHYKDNVGKDSTYLKRQPLAWHKANEILNGLVRREPTPDADIEGKVREVLTNFWLDGCSNNPKPGRRARKTAISEILSLISPAKLVRVEDEKIDLRSEGFDQGLTYAHNLCVQISDRHNGDDEITEAYTASDCANKIKSEIGQYRDIVGLPKSDLTTGSTPSPVTPKAPNV